MQKITLSFDPLDPKGLYSREPFTLTKGIAVQMEQLAEWRKKLSAECFQALEKECIKDNQALANKIVKLTENPKAKVGYYIDMNNQGFSVLRGSSLSNFVQNWQPKGENIAE